MPTGYRRFSKGEERDDTPQVQALEESGFGRARVGLKTADQGA